MSAADEKLPPEPWNQDGTITRPGHRILPVYNALHDLVRQDGGHLEVHGKKDEPGLLVVRRKDKQVMAQQPFYGDLEEAAKALSI